MKLRYLFLILGFSPLLTQAEIYKAVDENGHVTYSSVPIKGGRIIALDPLPIMQSPAHAKEKSSKNNPSPASFPKVDGATQKNRDDKRQQILQDELDAEVKLLEEAKKNLQDGKDNPEVFQVKVGTKPDGSPIMQTRRNAARYDEKVQKLTEQVELHQKNVEALKVELSKFK